MSAYVVISCDGHHERQRCVSQRVSSSRHAPTAVAEAQREGWVWRPGVGYLCPSLVGHDEPSPR